MGQTTLITIGALAKRTGVAVSALRFYADTELIPCARSDSGQRLFKREVIRRVSFILIAQQLGYSLADIQALIDQLPKSRTPTKKDWELLSRSFQSDLDDQISRLTALRDSLTGCIGCGCLSLQSCKLYNPADRAASAGTGPRYLMGDNVPDPKESP